MGIILAPVNLTIIARSARATDGSKFEGRGKGGCSKTDPALVARPGLRYYSKSLCELERLSELPCTAENLAATFGCRRP